MKETKRISVDINKDEENILDEVREYFEREYPDFSISQSFIFKACLKRFHKEKIKEAKE